MNINSISCIKENKDTINDILNSEFQDTDNNKCLENRKTKANEKFEKIGHLPNQGIRNINNVQESVEKIPVLDILSTNYQSELNFSDYHRACNCTKSYCLKLYCECFARDKLCVNCNCNNCMNNIGHEKSRSTAFLRILDKNPFAFLPKIGSGQGHKLHRKGCNCKRSECLKNYCECREAKIECSMLCRCQGCKNRSNELNVQMPCSIDMTMMDSNGFKNSSLFKSNSIMHDSDKSHVNTSNDLNYSFSNMYDDASLNQSNIYCNETPISEYGSHINYSLTNNTAIDNLMKINENYKNISENFYQHSVQQQTLSQNSIQFINSKDPQIMNWNSFMNSNQDRLDYKQLPKHNEYNILNYPKFSSNRQIQQLYPTSFTSDLDDNCNRLSPTNGFQYFNESDEYLDMSSMNYFKPYNGVQSRNRFGNRNHCAFAMPMTNNQGTGVHSSERSDQNDNAEVTSTNEMEQSPMLVSSNCDSMTQLPIIGDNSLVNQIICDSRSPQALSGNDNYNCFPFITDTIYSNKAKSNYDIKFTNPSQPMNGQVLPSLFHNDCSNMDLNSQMSYFCHDNVGQSQILSNTQTSPNMIMYRKSNQLPEESIVSPRYNNNVNSHPSFMNNPLNNEEMLHKSEPMVNGIANHCPIYSENLNPFFHEHKNDVYSKIVPCYSNPHY